MKKRALRHAVDELTQSLHSCAYYLSRLSDTPYMTPSCFRNINLTKAPKKRAGKKDAK